MIGKTHCTRTLSRKKDNLVGRRRPPRVAGLESRSSQRAKFWSKIKNYLFSSILHMWVKVKILFVSARMLLLWLVRSKWLSKRGLLAFSYHLSQWLVRNIWCVLSGMILVILQSNIKYLVPFLLISVRPVGSLTEVYGGPIIWSITSSMLRAVGLVSPTFSFSCMCSLLSCVRIWRKALKGYTAQYWLTTYSPSLVGADLSSKVSFSHFVDGWYGSAGCLLELMLKGLSPSVCRELCGDRLSQTSYREIWLQMPSAATQVRTGLVDWFSGGSNTWSLELIRISSWDCCSVFSSSAAFNWI